MNEQPSTGEPPALTSDYDSPWKEAIERYFEPFMAFFFPQAHAEIDWTKGSEFLDKELQQVVRDAEIGRKYVGKLVKVWIKNGSEAWVLVHIEVQSQKETGFVERMYIYHLRLFDRFHRLVASFAVLGTELLVWFYRQGVGQKGRDFIQTLQGLPNGVLVPISVEIATRAAGYRHGLGLATVDSLVLATSVVER